MQEPLWMCKGLLAALQREAKRMQADRATSAALVSTASSQLRRVLRLLVCLSERIDAKLADADIDGEAGTQQLLAIARKGLAASASFNPELAASTLADLGAQAADAYAQETTNQLVDVAAACELHDVTCSSPGITVQQRVAQLQLLVSTLRAQDADIRFQSQ
jgi:hypothetical protein